MNAILKSILSSLNLPALADTLVKDLEPLIPEGLALIPYNPALAIGIETKLITAGLTSVLNHIHAVAVDAIPPVSPIPVTAVVVTGATNS